MYSVAELEENIEGGRDKAWILFFLDIHTHTLINVRDKRKRDTQFYRISLFKINRKPENYKYQIF
jgi:hypothetical protein